jgi:hypothetical protein
VHSENLEITYYLMMDASTVLTLYSVDFKNARISSKVAHKAIPGFQFSSASTSNFANYASKDFYFFGATNQINSHVLTNPVGFIASFNTRRWSAIGFDLSSQLITVSGFDLN